MILAINGSPRKGNTLHMVKKVLEGCDAELINLAELKIEPCGGCNLCYEKKQDCYRKDELAPVLEKMKSASLFIFASPNYFSNVSWLMKLFMDRTNGLFATKSLKGKKAALVAVGGHLKDTMNCLNSLELFCKDHGMEVVGSVIAQAEKVEDISAAVQQECIKLGEKCQSYISKK